jgi:hypothetical protein
MTTCSPLTYVAESCWFVMSQSFHHQHPYVSLASCSQVFEVKLRLKDVRTASCEAKMLLCHSPLGGWRPAISISTQVSVHESCMVRFNFVITPSSMDLTWWFDIQKRQAYVQVGPFVNEDETVRTDFVIQDLPSLLRVYLEAIADFLVTRVGNCQMWQCPQLEDDEDLMTGSVSWHCYFS